MEPGPALTAHAEVGAAGLLGFSAILLDEAPVQGHVALVHLRDGQLAIGTLAHTPEHRGPCGIALQDAPPRDFEVAGWLAAVVQAQEAGLVSHTHRHRWRAPIYPQGLAPGACGEAGRSGTVGGDTGPSPGPRSCSTPGCVGGYEDTPRGGARRGEDFRAASRNEAASVGQNQDQYMQWG